MEIWKKYYYILALLFIFIMTYVYINNNTKAEYQTEIHFLELPVGNCTLIKTSKKNILIGEASKKDSKHISKYLDSQKINNISELIISFPDQDNIEGFVPLLEKDKIEKIYLPNITNLDLSTKEFLNTAKDKNISIYQIQGKEKWKLNELTLLFLRPSKSSIVPNAEKKSIIKLKLPKLSILWLPSMGEMDKTDLLLSSKDLQADILKVSGEERLAFLNKDFLDYVNPKTIIVGDSGKIKEDELRAIYRWNSNTKILPIDDEGDIIIYGKGKKYNITTKRMMKIRIQ